MLFRFCQASKRYSKLQMCPLCSSIFFFCQFTFKATRQLPYGSVDKVITLGWGGVGGGGSANGRRGCYILRVLYPVFSIALRFFTLGHVKGQIFEIYQREQISSGCNGLLQGNCISAQFLGSLGGTCQH